MCYEVGLFVCTVLHTKWAVGLAQKTFQHLWTESALETESVVSPGSQSL